MISSLVSSSINGAEAQAKCLQFTVFERSRGGQQQRDIRASWTPCKLLRPKVGLGSWCTRSIAGSLGLRNVAGARRRRGLFPERRDQSVDASTRLCFPGARLNPAIRAMAAFG